MERATTVKMAYAGANSVRGRNLATFDVRFLSSTMQFFDAPNQRV
jgi:hypothetical protein